MRKFISILLLISFLFTTSAIKAQAFFGFKVGANLATINGDINYDGIKPVMHIGAVAEMELDDFFSIQLEALYSMQGSQSKDDASLKNNHSYIIFPAMVKYFVTETISIDAGPQIGFLVFAKTSNGWEEWVDTKDMYKKFDYGINLGASLELDNGMNVNLRYNYGLANILKNENGSNFKAKNGVIQISMGYKFY